MDNCRRSRPWLGFLAVALAMVAACGNDLDGCEGVQGPKEPESWSQDLKFLRKKLEACHPNLYHTIRRADFRAQLNALDRALPEMDDAQIALGLAQIVASVGEGHTSLSLPQGPIGKKSYPLQLRWFGDELRVVATTADHADWLGGRIERIGSSPLAEVQSKIDPLIARDNGYDLLARNPRYLLNADVLRARGVVAATDPASWRIVDDQGQTQEAWLSKRPSHLWVEPVEIPLYRQRPHENYWFHWDESQDLLYVRYQRCRDSRGLSFRQFAGTVFAAADSHHPQKVLVDLRGNPGGNSSIMEPLLAGIQERPWLNTEGVLFVAIDRGSYSSGMLNALQLDRDTEAILIGEPTGGKPNSYGDILDFKLPWSRLRVIYATKYFRLLDDDPEALFPTVDVRPTIEEYLSGEDPVLAAVLAYPE